MYKVYVKLNDDKCITSIDSEIFLTDDEIQGMTNIDEGEGDKFVHAQSQYLEKSLYDELGRYNYKYIDGAVVEIAEEDKPTPTTPKKSQLGKKRLMHN